MSEIEIDWANLVPKLGPQPTMAYNLDMKRKIDPRRCPICLDLKEECWNDGNKER